MAPLSSCRQELLAVFFPKEVIKNTEVKVDKVATVTISKGRAP